MDIETAIATAKETGKLMAQDHPLLLLSGGVVLGLFVIIAMIKLRQDAKASPQASPQSDANALHRTPEIDDAPDRDKVMRFRIETSDSPADGKPNEDNTGQ